jgi:hypothetical protein
VRGQDVILPASAITSWGQAWDETSYFSPSDKKRAARTK